jgi:hypothetical protein
VARAIATRLASARFWLATTGAILAFLFVLLRSGEAIPQEAPTQPPQLLRDTGLYSDFATLEIDPRHLSFSPQYPLWTDGAAKRRWISLPPGTAIDGSDPDAWIFPIGTRLWKEFSFAGQRVETRYIERMADGRWLYAAYEWSPDGREARLAPERGKRNAFPLSEGRSHTIPGAVDCQVCHQGGPTPVLGFSALQLSPDRDPGALHAELQSDHGVDLRYLVEKGLLVGLPERLQMTPPRIVARSAIERAALGYLHGNCGHCHNGQGSLQNIGLYLRQMSSPGAADAVATTIGHPVKKLAPGQPPDTEVRIEPGHPERSGLAQRMGSRYPAMQMPPLGTELVDEEAVSLLRRWISELEGPDADVPQQQGGT